MWEPVLPFCTEWPSQPTVVATILHKIHIHWCSSCIHTLGRLTPVPVSKASQHFLVFTIVSAWPLHLLLYPPVSSAPKLSLRLSRISAFQWTLYPTNDLWALISDTFGFLLFNQSQVHYSTLSQVLKVFYIISNTYIFGILWPFLTYWFLATVISLIRINVLLGYFSLRETV